MTRKKLVLLQVRPLASLAVTLGVSIGCTPPHAHGPEDVDSTEASDREIKPVPAEPTPVAEDVVERAARPFTGYRAFDQKPLPPEIFFTHLAAADAVCFGEKHDDPLDHYAELELIRALAARRAIRGFELGVGFEMVRTSYQTQLNHYEVAPEPFAKLAGKIDWAREWNYPEPLYAPLFERAGDEGAQLVALGVPRSITRGVAELGLAELDADRKALLPELDLGNAKHRALFDQQMENHPGAADMDLNRFYEAQVVWDESMADKSAQFLAERLPARKLLILAGALHCHKTAIVDRLQRRGAFDVVSVLASVGVPRDDEISRGYDYQFVFTE